MSDANIERLAENSIIAWLQNTAQHGVTVTGANFYNGDGNGDLALPFVAVKCQRRKECIHDSGVWELGADVHFHSQADDTTIAAEQANWGAICAILSCSPLAPNLSTTGFHCHGAVRDQAGQHGYTDRSFVKTYSMTLFAMGMTGP